MQEFTLLIPPLRCSSVSSLYLLFFYYYFYLGRSQAVLNLSEQIDFVEGLISLKFSLLLHVSEMIQSKAGLDFFQLLESI